MSLVLIEADGELQRCEQGKRESIHVQVREGFGKHEGSENLASKDWFKNGTAENLCKLVKCRQHYSLQLLRSLENLFDYNRKEIDLKTCSNCFKSPTKK